MATTKAIDLLDDCMFTTSSTLNDLDKGLTLDQGSIRDILSDLYDSLDTIYSELKEEKTS